jgi:hypothetical protein
MNVAMAVQVGFLTAFVAVLYVVNAWCVVEMRTLLYTFSYPRWVRVASLVSLVIPGMAFLWTDYLQGARHEGIIYSLGSMLRGIRSPGKM